MSQLRQREKVLSPAPSGSIQDLNGLDDSHPHWRGPSSLPSLLFQTLISPGHTLTDTPRHNALPAVRGHLGAWSRWHIKFTIACAQTFTPIATSTSICIY